MAGSNIKKYLLYTFYEHILEHINAPLSGLYYNTEKCIPEN